MSPLALLPPIKPPTEATEPGRFPKLLEYLVDESCKGGRSGDRGIGRIAVLVELCVFDPRSLGAVDRRWSPTEVNEVVLGFVLCVGVKGLADDAAAACAIPGLRNEADDGDEETVADLNGCIELMEGRRPCAEDATGRS